MSVNSFSFMPFLHRTFLLKSLHYQLVQSKYDRNRDPFSTTTDFRLISSFLQSLQVVTSFSLCPVSPKAGTSMRSYSMRVLPTAFTPSVVYHHCPSASLQHLSFKWSQPPLPKLPPSHLSFGTQSSFPVCGLPHTGTLSPCLLPS